MICDASDELPFLKRLSNLRYLAAEFPVDSGFFICGQNAELADALHPERAREAQLEAAGKTAAFATALHCRGNLLGRGNKSFEARNFKNVKDFRRPGRTSTSWSIAGFAWVRSGCCRWRRRQRLRPG